MKDAFGDWNPILTVQLSAILEEKHFGPDDDQDIAARRSPAFPQYPSSGAAAAVAQPQEKEVALCL